MLHLGWYWRLVLEVFSAFPFVSKLVKYYSKLCKYFPYHSKIVCRLQKYHPIFVIKCEEFREFVNF